MLSWPSWQSVPRPFTSNFPPTIMVIYIVPSSYILTVTTIVCPFLRIQNIYLISLVVWLLDTIMVIYRVQSSCTLTVSTILCPIAEVISFVSVIIYFCTLKSEHLMSMALILVVVLLTFWDDCKTLLTNIFSCKMPFKNLIWSNEVY